MKCQCGNDKAYMIRVTYEGEEYCDRCGNISSQGVPDVYFNHRHDTFDNLCVDGKSVTFSSKRDKARFMKSRGYAEMGDRDHGAPITGLRGKVRDREKGRQEVRRAIHLAREQLRRKYA